jgi:hypothetical protein
MLNTTRMILKAQKDDGFYPTIIVGPQSIGKTTYAFAVGRELAVVNGIADSINDDTAWKWAIDQCIYSTEDFINIRKQHHFKNKRLFVIWEDAGTTAGSYAFARGWKYPDALKAQLDLIRTSVTSLLITSPTHSDLFKFIRRYAFYKTKISIANQNHQRRAATYHKVNKPNKSGDERLVWQFYFDDYYSSLAPDKWYGDYYMPIRRKWEDKINKKLESYFDMFNKKEQIEMDKLEVDINGRNKRKFGAAEETADQ